MKSIKKWICVLAVSVIFFSAFADTRLITGGGPMINLWDYDYYDDVYKRSEGIVPTVILPTFLFGIPTGTNVTPLLGVGAASIIYVNAVSLSTGVSIELPKFGYFSHDLMFLFDFNCVVYFIFGIVPLWYLTFEVPYMFSFPSRKGFCFGLGPQLRFHQQGNYTHYHRYDAGIEFFIGARW